MQIFTCFPSLRMNMGKTKKEMQNTPQTYHLVGCEILLRFQFYHQFLVLKRLNGSYGLKHIVKTSFGPELPPNGSHQSKVIAFLKSTSNFGSDRSFKGFYMSKMKNFFLRYPQFFSGRYADFHIVFLL